MYDLSDAQEYLGDLIEQMSKAGTIDDADFSVQMARIFVHLNRACKGRGGPRLGKVPDDVHAEPSKFPVEIDRSDKTTE
jgi:hypothetical protein